MSRTSKVSIYTLQVKTQFAYRQCVSWLHLLTVDCCMGLWSAGVDVETLYNDQNCAKEPSGVRDEGWREGALCR